VDSCQHEYEQHRLTRQRAQTANYYNSHVRSPVSFMRHRVIVDAQRTGWPKKVIHFRITLKSHWKTRQQSRFFIKYQWNKAPEYYHLATTRDLICGIINYCAFSFHMTKISVAYTDQIVIRVKTLKQERWKSKKCLHEFSS